MIRRQLQSRLFATASTKAPTATAPAASETGSGKGLLAALAAQTSATTYTGRFVQEGPGGRNSTNGHVVTVFGCTGFLGRYLVNELGKNGSQVVAAYRGSQESPRHLKVMGDLGQIVPLRFDLADKESVMACIRHSDIVYNLIGRDYETRNFDFNQVHVDAARTIAEACREAGVRRLVHVSALNASTDSTSEFFKSKALGEIAVRKAFPEAIIVRPGSLFGWEDRLFTYLGVTVTHPVKKYLMFGGFMPMVAGGKRSFFPTYVGDVGRGLEALIRTDTPAPLYEFHGKHAISYKDFCLLFCEYARRPFAPLSVPYSLFRRIVSWTQNSPIARLTVHDVDRAVLDDKLDESAARLEDVGVLPQNVDTLAIRFVRHYRSDKWVDQPASLAEVKTFRDEA